MAKLSKRVQALRAKVDRNKNYPLTEALALVKESATAKFDESVDIAVNLGVDAKKSDQLVRGSVVLPAGTGKSVRVAVFAQGDKAEAARAAGADVVGFDDLHLWYFGDHPRSIQSELSPDERVSDFGEVVKGLTADEADFEARRCLSCGNCFECDGCYGACPEDAIIKLGKGHRYRFDYAKCTGCATCYDQCPVHAIEMIQADLVGS